MRLSRSESVPWAFSRSDLFSGQWLLLSFWRRSCMSWPSRPKQATTAGARISVTASGENQSIGFILDELSSTKYFTYLVVMELSEQMRFRNMIFSIAWRLRDENEEADEVYTGFDPGLRVSLQWDKLEFFVLPHLTELAEAHFKN